MAKLEESKPKVIPNAFKFILGGAAGMGATLFVQPLDLIKKSNAT